MKLTLLGTGGYFPTARRQTACLLLPEIGVVLDAGSGMGRLGKYLATDRLDIFLTHAHLDHVHGLTFLISVLPPEVARNSIVHGEPAKLAAVSQHLFDAAIFPVQPLFRLVPLAETWPLPGDGKLSHFQLRHPGGSIGYRLDWPNRSMAYVTDTTAAADAEYIDKIRGVDLLVHECYFADDAGQLPAKTGHSWLLPVAELAAAANVGRLVLVHIGPQYEDDSEFDLAPARQIFHNVEIGTDQLELDF